MLPFREIMYVDTMVGTLSYIMVGDIGGTNSNFGFFQEGDLGFTLIFSIHVKSMLIIDFVALVKDILVYVKQRYHISIVCAGFAVAGIVTEMLDYVQLTNLSLRVNVEKIKKVTGLSSLLVVNDFAVIGYGLAYIKATDLVLVHPFWQTHETQETHETYQESSQAQQDHEETHQKARQQEDKKTKKEWSPENKAIIGAGTGLGKSIMAWNKCVNRYVPIVSEGGHADFPIHNQLEFDLVRYIKEKLSIVYPLSWEDLLSGRGIEHIYSFFCDTDYEAGLKETVITPRTPQKSVIDALPLPEMGRAAKKITIDKIFESRFCDIYAERTWALYAKIYARCAKDFALEACALGGVYIGGGIAAKNSALFTSDIFLQEFTNSSKHQTFLKQMPIYIIADYNVSLYGIAHYLKLEGLCS